MTWWSSLNCWRNCKSSESSGRLIWKESDFISTWAKPRSGYLGRCLMCFRSLAKTLVLCTSRASAHTNSIYGSGCSSWVHKRYICITGPLKPDPSFRCKWCTGQARPIDGRPMTQVTVGREKFEVVPSFCYLWDCLSSDGSCEIASFTRCRVAWDKFNEPLPILISCSLPFTYRRIFYNSCVRSAMLHASETWAQTSSDCYRLQRNGRAMIRWCSVSPPKTKSARKISCRGCSWMIWQKCSTPIDTGCTAM